MMKKYSLKKPLLEKNDVELDEFKRRFYRNLFVDNQVYEDNQFDETLEELHKKDQEQYKKWRNTLGKISYTFIKKYPELTKELIAKDKQEALLKAFEMEKRKLAIISNSIPMKTTVTNVSDNKKELIASLNMELDLLESELEDNAVKRAQLAFFNYYGDCEKDPYLCNLYNEIINCFEVEIRKALEKELAKITEIDNKAIEVSRLSMMVETSISLKRQDHHKLKSYCYIK